MKRRLEWIKPEGFLDLLMDPKAVRVGRNKVVLGHITYLTSETGLAGIERRQTDELEYTSR